MKRSNKGEVYHLTNQKMIALMKAMMEKVEWDPLPDDWEDHTVFVGGKPIPVAEFIQTYPSEKHWLEGDE